jgi:tRNA pseudouridine55 synthase
MITKHTNDFSNLNFEQGETILVDKPKYWTSFKVVHKIKKATGVKRVGHAGTLDPMATGLLIISTGKKTKEINKYQELNKTYTGTFILGKSSPSMDTETEATEKPIPGDLNKDYILSLAGKFLGEIEQMPPMYSAVQVGGKKLYKLARKGKTVERKTRKVFIEDFKILSFNLPEIQFEITCSKGTYIRVIAHDLGERVGCGALLGSLRRTRIGSYNVAEALKIDEFLSRISSFSNDFPNQTATIAR